MILQAYQSTIQRFYNTANDISLRSHLHDIGNTFDREGFHALGASGLYRLAVPTSDGGSGQNLHELGAALYSVALHSTDLGFAASLCAHLCAIATLARFGTKEAKQHCLPKLIDGTWCASVANSEPNASTDLMNLKTASEPTPQGYLLSGHKHSITNVSEADLHIVSARLTTQTPHPINAFVVLNDAPGLTTERLSDLTTLRTSPTGDLTLDQTPIPDTYRLGEDGLKVFQLQFAFERLLTGFLYLAALEIVLERSINHAQTRKQFGRPIGSNQYVQDKIVRARVARDLLATHLEASISRWSTGHNMHGALSVLKIYGIEAATNSTRDIISLIGGQALRRTDPIEKLMRDLLGLSLLGGTVELHKIVLYNDTLRANRDASSSAT